MIIPLEKKFHKEENVKHKQVSETLMARPLDGRAPPPLSAPPQD